MAKVILDVPDISCGHCKASIESALGKAAGISGVQVDIATKRVFLDYDPAKISLENVSTILDDEGYAIASQTQG